jgi:hypothetical protein
MIRVGNCAPAPPGAAIIDASEKEKTRERPNKEGAVGFVSLAASPWGGAGLVVKGVREREQGGERD